MATTNVDQEVEVWKDIPGYEGKYQVSSIGRFKNLERYVNTGPDKKGKRKVPERILAYRKHPLGYYQMPIRGGAILAHRAVALAFIPNPLNKPFVNHIDGNKRNNKVENLEWATRQENEDHAVATGLKRSAGQSNTQAKLTDDIVRQMRSMYKRHQVTYVMIGNHFGVHWQTVKRVVTRERWSHVQ